jgi:hypothetical protein
MLETTGIGGDADLDADVDLDDFNTLATNFGTAGHTWLTGDFTADGTVNLDDFNVLASSFGISAGPDGIVDPQDWAALVTAIPEPSLQITGMATSIAMCIARNRRVRSIRHRAPPHGWCIQRHDGPATARV